MFLSALASVFISFYELAKFLIEIVLAPPDILSTKSPEMGFDSSP